MPVSGFSLHIYLDNSGEKTFCHDWLVKRVRVRDRVIKEFYFYFYFYFSVLKEATRLLLVDEIWGDAVGPLICSHRGFFFFFLGS